MKARTMTHPGVPAVLAAAAVLILAGCEPPDRQLRLDEPGAVLEITGDIDRTIRLEPTTRWDDRDLDDERDLRLRFGRRDRLTILGHAPDDTMTTGGGLTISITVDAGSFNSHDGECTATFDDITQTQRTEPHATVHVREARGTLTCTDLTGRHREGPRTINVEAAFHHRAEHERGP